jgi:hypothetical protein
LKPRHRIILVILLPLLALVLAACEEGDEVEITPGDGQEIDLDVTAPADPAIGDTVDIRATVTEEGEPVRAVEVSFDTTVPNVGVVFSPNPVSTSAAGTADTRMSTTVATPSQVTVTASTADGFQRLTIFLDPAP